jgi:hypothetical protein
MARTTWLFRQLDRLQFPHLYMLLLFLAMLVSMPLLSGAVATLVLMLTLMVSALLLRGGRRLNRPMVLIFALPVLVLVCINLITPDWLDQVAGPSATGYAALAGLVFIIYSIVIIARAMLTTRRVTTDVILAAVNLYIMIGITWAFIYFLVHDASSGMFNVPPIPGNREGDSQALSTFIYYSFVTQATQGYGDITPQRPLARMLVVIHTMVGQFYAVLIMAYLVSIYIGQRREQDRQGNGPPEDAD